MRKILIIQQKMIGDVLASSILCEALKVRFRESELHYLINSHTTPVLEYNPFIDQRILFTPEIENSRKLQRTLAKRLEAENYDAVIDVYSKIGSARLTGATKAPIRVGHGKWYTKWAYTHTFTPLKEGKTQAGRAIENRMRLLTPIANDLPLALKPKLYLTPTEKEQAKQQLDQHKIDVKKPLFMIGLLGSSDHKTYPLPALAQVLDHLVAQTQGQLLLNYMPQQQAAVDTVLTLVQPTTRKHIFDTLYGRSLREFMALTAHCDALIGNEGGAINMAKALDIPTFAIFSPWIKKAVWAIYQDEKNVSVHLSDLQPELHSTYKIKALKKQYSHFYDQLTPTYINQRLNLFLAAIKE